MASLQLFRRYDDGDAADGEDLTTTTSRGQLQLIRVSETSSASEESYEYDELQDEAMASDDIIIEPSSYRKRSSKSGGGLFKTVVEGTGAGYAGVKQYLDGDLSPYKTSPRQSDEKDSFSSGGQTETDDTGMSENDGSASAENDPGFSEASHGPSKPAEDVSDKSETSNEESTAATAINLESDSSKVAEPESVGIRASMEAKLGSEAEETEDTQPKLDTDSVVSNETQAPTEPKTEFDEGNIESVEIADYKKPADSKTEPEMVTEELFSTESMKKEASDKPISSYVEALKEGLPEIGASDEQSSVEIPGVEQSRLPDLTVSQIPKKGSSGEVQTDVQENESAGDGQTNLPEKGNSGNFQTQLPESTGDAKSVTVIADLAENESSGELKSQADVPEKESSSDVKYLADLPAKEIPGNAPSESGLSTPDKKHSGDVFINDADGTQLPKTESSVQLPTIDFLLKEESSVQLPTVDDLLKEESFVQLPTVDDLPKKESCVQISPDGTVKAETVRNQTFPVPEMDLPAAVEASWSGSSSRLPTITISEASEKSMASEGDPALVAVAKVITCTKDETKTVTAIATGSSVEDEGHHSQQQPAQPHRMGPLERFRNKVREKLSQVRLNKGRKESAVDEFGDLFNVYGSSSPR